LYKLLSDVLAKVRHYSTDAVLKIILSIKLKIYIEKT